MEDFEIYRDTNKSTMKYGFNAINSCFWLNGAATTALIAREEYQSALPFALGALSAILAFGLAYFAQLGISEAWKPSRKTTYQFFGVIKVNEHTGEKYRCYTFYAWLASFICALWGVIAAAKKLT